MHQHPILANKASMEISNFEVVNGDRFSNLFKLSISNLNLVTVNGNKYVTNFKVTCRYPPSFFNVERVICSSVNSFAVSS